MSTAPNPLRIVYMGTPEFAVPALNALATSRDKVVGVFTNPDRESGRGKKVTPPAVKVAAQAAKIPVFQPKKARGPEVVEKLNEWNPDVIVVAAYGQILKPDVLELPRYGCLNIHASLLPKYRGAAPINWAIVRGEEETGVTIMQMDEGLDTGPMLLKKKTLIGPLETAQELHDRLSLMGAELIVDVMRLIHLESLNPVEQNNDRSSYAPMLSKKDGLIDWTKSAEEVANHILGFNPWPGAYAFLTTQSAGEDQEPERIKFHLARPLSEPPETFMPRGAVALPGSVLRADRSEKELWIATGDGILRCLELQAAGKRAMEVGDFLNGHDITEGDRFS